MRLNCDNALSVGINSQEDLIGETCTHVKLQRKIRVKFVSSMNNSMKIRGEEVVVHPQQMQNLILSIMDSTTD